VKGGGVSTFVQSCQNFDVKKTPGKRRKKRQRKSHMQATRAFFRKRVGPRSFCGDDLKGTRLKNSIDNPDHTRTQKEGGLAGGEGILQLQRHHVGRFLGDSWRHHKQEGAGEKKGGSGGEPEEEVRPLCEGTRRIYLEPSTWGESRPKGSISIEGWLRRREGAEGGGKSGLEGGIGGRKTDIRGKGEAIERAGMEVRGKRTEGYWIFEEKKNVDGVRGGKGSREKTSR